MNMGRGCVATHEYLERGARSSMGVAFVGECWVERGGQGIQPHADYVWLRCVSAAHGVMYFGLHSLLDVCPLVECAHQFVCVGVEGLQIGGVYGQCGERVHDMEKWL